LGDEVPHPDEATSILECRHLTCFTLVVCVQGISPCGSSVKIVTTGKKGSLLVRSMPDVSEKLSSAS
jgi:hypothetical protein